MKLRYSISRFLTGVGWRMFHCERRSLDLSVQSCAADFQRVEKRGALPWRSDWHCQNCEMGATHAGRDVVVVQAATALAGARLICARCHRPDERFIGNRLCRSCDARDRELARGRNGKGTFPSVLAARWHLHSVVLWIVGIGGRVVNRASDALEAILTTVRKEKQVLQFARTVPGYPPIRQLTFWGGC